MNIVEVTRLSDSSSDSESSSSSSESESNSSGSESNSSSSESSSSSSDSSSESSSDSEEELVHLNKRKKLDIPEEEGTKFQIQHTQDSKEECKDHTTPIEEKTYKTISIMSWLRKRRDAKRERDEKTAHTYNGYSTGSSVEDKYRKPDCTQTTIKQAEVNKQIDENKENMIHKKELKQSASPVAKTDLKKITLSRDKMESLVHHPCFDKIAQGCFVRVGMVTGAERGYVISQIIGIRQTPNFYQLGSNKTNKGLLLRAGKDVIPLQFISNQEFTDPEFSRWQTQCAHQGIPMPTLDGIARKLTSMSEAMAKSKENVDKRTAERSQYQGVSNAAKRKIQLRFHRDEAAWRGDHKTAMKLDLEIKKLEEMNVKVKQENQRSAIAGSKFLLSMDMNESNFEMSQEDNPFSRKATRPKLFTRKDRQDYT